MPADDAINNIDFPRWKSIFKFPNEKPNVPEKKEGWFGGYHERFFSDIIINKKVKLILELGSWLGKSATYYLNLNPNVKVICVDTWKGSVEHNGMEILNTLYETWAVNMWDYQDRVIPLRMNSLAGLATAYKYGIEPDMIYIDASHQYEDVYADLLLAYSLFPNAIITGDDWNWKNKDQGNRRTVNEAVNLFCKNNNQKVVPYHNVWRLEYH